MYLAAEGRVGRLTCPTLLEVGSPLNIIVSHEVFFGRLACTYKSDLRR